MHVAYVDTSCLVAIAFGEARGRRVAALLERYDRLVSDNLLEAELRAAFAREGRSGEEEKALAKISWIFPAEALSDEYRTALEHGGLRGADLRHVACALYLDRIFGKVDFLSLDERQVGVASSAGLTTKL